MEEQPTCGRGLAEHSVLPAKLAELIASVAENLEVHLKTLDLEDPDAQKEHDAYVKLAEEHRELAARLQAAARHMAGYRDLPMGRHDERALSDPKLLEAFQKFVRIKQELLVMLQKAVEQEQEMLRQME